MTLAVTVSSVIGLLGVSASAGAAEAVNGAGSSFAAPAIEAFTKTVGQTPYNLTVNFSSTSSSDGRYGFASGSTDFGVTDTPYGLGTVAVTPPPFPFAYIPIVAAGIAFMYNVPGLTKTLQLSSSTACALLTGGITNWDDPALAADNPGVSLPNLPVRPVTESDSAGTNLALEKWCIAEQPKMWAAFADQQNTQPGGPGGGVMISATSAESNWPALNYGFNQDSTSGVAGTIATSAGAVGGVETKYASDLGFGPTTPAKGVASVLNASGKYTQPTPIDIDSALAYATQLANGEQEFDFNGLGPNVYNPSTYSYLLTPTKGWSPAKGAVLSAFVNYALTLGQHEAPEFGYASLGLPLERYGIDAVLADVPGAVAPTQAELAAYACGDLTPSEVAAGQTTPSCTSASPAPPTTIAGGGSGATVQTDSSASGGSVTAGSDSGSVTGSSDTSGSSSSGSSGDSSAAVQSESPSTSGLAFTGGDPLPLGALGVVMLASAWFIRRRLIRHLATPRTACPVGVVVASTGIDCRRSWAGEHARGMSVTAPLCPYRPRFRDARPLWE